MQIRPYLTFQGTCNEAIALYKEAFKTELLEISYFSELAGKVEFSIPEEYAQQVLQATMKFGDEFIRLSDCGPGGKLNDPESERISLAIEAKPAEIEQAFTVLAKDGRIGIPLAETFYSPCAGVVFDKFGVMWNLIGREA